MNVTMKAGVIRSLYRQ